MELNTLEYPPTVKKVSKLAARSIAMPLLDELKKSDSPLKVPGPTAHPGRYRVVAACEPAARRVCVPARPAGAPARLVRHRFQ